MPSTTSYVAFAGPRQIAAGHLDEVLPVLKRRFDADRADLPLVFEVETGRQVDFDLRGTLDDVLVRATPPRRTGPGRPRLGVSGREVTLLPRHWQWLDAQPGGASAALRRLVDAAARAAPDAQAARARRDALVRVLSALAGDRPRYEDATRALYRGELDQFAELIAGWPKDIRAFALAQATG